MKANIWVVVAILFACVCVGADAGERRLYIGSAVDGLHAAQQLVSSGFDVHGFYEDIVIASTNDEILKNRIHGLPIVLHHRAGIEEGTNYYVLERKVFFNRPPVELKINATVFAELYRDAARAVVSTTSSAQVVLATIGEDVELIPVDLELSVQLGPNAEQASALLSIYAHAIKRYTTPEADPTIQQLVDQVSPATLRAFVTYLSGEDPTSNILTRNSRSAGAKEAQDWLLEQFTRFGLQASAHQFNTQYSSNVVGIKLGVTDPSKVVIVGAHYDSRGPNVSSATQRAPGANDNGSGTGAVLQIAKIFNDSGAQFEHTVHFVVYSGEEQGLLGSAAYAQRLVDNKVNVIGVFNADMVAFRVPSEHTQCAFPSRYSTPELEALAKKAVTTFVPALTIGTTTACCSDHQSYYNRGIPATGFFERNGPIADNQYHKSEDLVDRSGYDIDGQYTQLTQAVLASVATLAVMVLLLLMMMIK